MEKTIINVTGMNCQHCKQTIEENLSALPGVTHVTVNLTNNNVLVEHDMGIIPVDKLKAEIDDLGYDVK